MHGNNGRDLLARPAPRPEPAAAEPLLIDIPEAARRLAVSMRTVERLIAGGELPTVRIGRRLLVNAEALAQWVRGRTN